MAASGVSLIEEPQERKRKRDGEQVNGTSDKTSKKRRHKKSKVQDSADRSVALQPFGKSTLTAVEAEPGDEEHQAWHVSLPVGGKFIHAEPVFTPDEKLIIFATESAVHAYSTVDSSLYQTLRAPQSSTFSTYALSSIDPNILYAATLEGQILQWDIKTGSLSKSWTVQGSIRHLVVSVNPNDKQDRDLLFLVTKSSDGQWLVGVYHTEDITSEQDIPRPSFKTLLNAGKPLTGLKVVQKGTEIVATTIDSLIVGTLFHEKTLPSQKLRYVWREVTCQEAPASFDVRARQTQLSGGATKTPRSVKSSEEAAIDVVVGGVKGCIFVFDDLLSNLGHLEKPSKDIQSSGTLKGRSLHWHREAVGSVAWSRDGNYIVSGGKETVLVLWQLRTGSKQFLPNLESPIQSIVVSPSGSSYAVHLGDNSVMVISTSELTPKAYIAGIQTMSFSSVVKPAPQVTTLEKVEKAGQQPQSYVIPATLHPRLPNRVLATVAGFQTSDGLAATLSRACYLQDFDISTSRHESRQAIARTNAISSNLGPEGNRILEPEVKHLRISHDGRWLATVDEWAMPDQDVKKLSATMDSLAGYRESRLRFWSWNGDENSWALHSRIEDPHMLEEAVNSGAVLDLAASPDERRFATIGTDSIARIWTLKSKATTFRSVQADDSQLPKEESWWTVQHSIPLESSMETDPLMTVSPRDAILAYSLDGSCLAVYLHYDHEENEDCIYFVDTNQGVIREVKRDIGLNDTSAHELKFLGRYLIVAGSSSVAVWDVTTMELQGLIELPDTSSKRLMSTALSKDSRNMEQPTGSPAVIKSHTHLEVDPSSSTFAVALASPASKGYRTEGAHPILEYETRLLIYSLENLSKAVHDAELPRLTAALLAAGSSKIQTMEQTLVGQSQGYVILDIGAEVRRVTPRASTLNLEKEFVDSLEEEKGAEAAQTNGLSNGTSVSPSPEESADEAAGALKDMNGYIRNVSESEQVDNRPVVRKEQLASVFDYPTHLMPSIQDLFWNVLSLYAEKPVHGGVEMEAMDGITQSQAATERFEEGQEEESSEASSDSDSSSDGEDD